MNWIKTDDELPKDDQFCWLWPAVPFNSGWYCSSRLGFWRGEMFVDINQITHWMPFYSPEAPSD